MSTSRLIHKATTKKLSDFKNVHKCTTSYQAAFDKVVNILTKILHYTWQSIKMYFQATRLMNIGPEYSRLVFTIQKNWKDETINFVKAILQIIRHFKFMKGTKKYKSVFSTSQTFANLLRSTLVALKRLYKNLKYIKKSLTIYYTNCY